MKHCIWCNKYEPDTSFLNVAHTIPKTLGGKSICLNVCDKCNAHFGERDKGMPSIEAVIKETFNVARIRFLEVEKGIGKNKPLPKISSQYFNINLAKRKITLKPAYILQKGFQERLGHQLKRGLYKIFLEEIERQTGDGHNSNYDFIREFSRYGLSDYPVFYFRRIYGIIPVAIPLVVNPEIFFEEDHQAKYLVREPQFFEFELLGHVFGIVTSKYWQLSFDNYLSKTTRAKEQFFNKLQSINKLSDVDILLTILDK